MWSIPIALSLSARDCGSGSLSISASDFDALLGALEYTEGCCGACRRKRFDETVAELYAMAEASAQSCDRPN